MGPFLLGAHPQSASAPPGTLLISLVFSRPQGSGGGKCDVWKRVPDVEGIGKRVGRGLTVRKRSDIFVLLRDKYITFGG